MKIEYFGHSCFKITDGTRSVVFDPFADIGYDLPKIKADFCVCSHKHYDHFATQAVDCKAVITEQNVAKYPFLKAIDSFHDECKGAKRGKNTIFIFTADDGLTFCHMGDIGEPFADFAKKRSITTDILAIPVGGNYTIDSGEAVKYYKAIKPELVIPMHYKTARSNIDIAGKKNFLNKFTFESIAKADSPLNITNSDFAKGGKYLNKVIDFNDNEF